MLIAWLSKGKVLWLKISTAIKFGMIKLVNINFGQSKECLKVVCYS